MATNKCLIESLTENLLRLQQAVDKKELNERAEGGLNTELTKIDDNLDSLIEAIEKDDAGYFQSIWHRLRKD